MHIRFIDSLTLDIYIKKELIGDINFNNKDDLEKYLKELFKTLKNKYDVLLEGFYDITVYIDKYYGVVFHLEKEDIDYYEYFKNQIDMRIITINNEFLYLVDDIPFNLLDKIDIFMKNNKIYLKLKKKLNGLEMMRLLENSIIVYDE